MNSRIPTPSKSIFTKREFEILKLISDGNSSKQIANHLKVTEATVKTHRKNILKKAGGKNIMQIIKDCVTTNII